AAWILDVGGGRDAADSAVVTGPAVPHQPGASAGLDAPGSAPVGGDGVRGGAVQVRGGIRGHGPAHGSSGRGSSRRMQSASPVRSGGGGDARRAGGGGLPVCRPGVSGVLGAEKNSSTGGEPMARATTVTTPVAHLVGPGKIQGSTADSPSLRPAVVHRCVWRR